MVVGEILHEKDVVVIGAGPAGYEAAFRAAKNGRDVTLVDRFRSGGECLHSGCIPSKLLATAARKLEEKTPGVRTTPTFCMDKWQEEKRALIGKMEKGLHHRFKLTNIECVKGEASFRSHERIGVEQGEKFEVWSFNHVILATGSRPISPDFLTFAHPHIFPLEQLYTLSSLPHHLVLFGADYLTVEAASTFRALGVKVTIVTDQQNILPEWDESIQRELKRQLKKQKVTLYTGVSGCQVKDQGLVLGFCNDRGETVEVETEMIAYSIGRVGNGDSLGLDQAGVDVQDNGTIPISEKCQTTRANIYACGDVTGDPTLAVKGIKQGKTAADHCCGKNTAYSLDCLPKVIQTQTPMSSVGLTENEAKEAGYEVITASSSMRANGYAMVNGDTEGLIVVHRDRKSHVLLGFHAIGTGAVELIEKATLALEMGARDEDFTYPYTPHPGYGEAWTDAVEMSAEESNVKTKVRQ